MIKQLLAGVALAAAALCTPAQAQGYPSKPVNIVVPFAPGGATDIMTRLLAERLSKRLGQPVIVENKPGAGTMIASEYVAKAPADGHTVLMAASSLGIAPSLYSKVNYDPVKSFAPISLVASVVHVLEVHPSVPVKSVGELITWLKANPGKANYGSVGAGTSTHLESELFNTMAGVKMVHVPYKGSAPALTDLVGGSLQVMFDAWASSGPFVKDGKTRLLAVTTAQRSRILPDVPTVAESGLPGYEAMPWLGLLAPAGTPDAVVRKFHDELIEVLKEQPVQEKFHSLGLDIIGNTPQEFAEFIKKDITKWAKVIQETGAKAN
ncbi:MAG TPA: tripartite tricarboxylate transporter substrate binding protein [Ottowia sp.]|uniref:tripartite tricarboxylate transporter substrate binding protein n=1 Tax=Ottowia sp. TaxID=1898956 RepID=UPI002D1C6D23|nr:tripartite tricarboxylate transporter substrate binding protein [Ottowia sp.]HNE59194.1 tripartite tricarboxylate transporter substrate binding protein [Ottowia sp.]HNI85761.1 tripartite tricarboxylate transporter substrate binding protein [Ottowia sp.]HNJ44640.1 tripartite tricarboxylate transporter substrate binding protein [Ottowia sp.]HNK53709.1 tripartite tricarboxylate transporter substrate binding protein [Ottowia sp.]HNL42409.1 tripartite tricarboxylate transporter substrate binding